MTLQRTELEWEYQPGDFFEVAYRHAESEYDILVEGGRAVATLSVPQEPVDEQLENRIGAHLGAIFLVRQLEVHRTYTLKGPLAVYQHAGSRKNVAIRVGSASLVMFQGQVDAILRDAAGNILRDTKAERIAQHTALLDSVAPKLALSSTLRGLLESYSRAVSDPSNEFFHLYEIRDTLVKYYGGEKKARPALGITRAEWQRLGFLANVEALEQGRHRGEHVAGRRNASDAELQEARGIVRNWISAFAQTV